MNTVVMRNAATIIPPVFELQDHIADMRARAKAARERAARDLELAEELEESARRREAELSEDGL